MYFPRIYLEGLRETLQNLRIFVSVPPKIRTMHLFQMSQKRYCVR